MKKLNKPKLTEKIHRHEPIKLSFKYIDEDILIITNSILARILAETDQTYLLNTAITVMREVLVNALKANAKRVYFKKMNLDINNPGDYEKGMADFKTDIIGEFDAIESDLNNSDYFVETLFHEQEIRLVIQISNNSPILPEEMERIQYRIQKAVTLKDFTDAYEDIQDSTEGAGLGIVLTILLLNNMGVDSKNFKIARRANLTVTSITIPRQLKPQEVVTRVKEKILAEVEGIPTFPENILQLQRLCNDPDALIEEISRRISSDPALTTDIIKLSNSAGFVTGKRIETVSTAVMTIGLKNVNAILMASSARRILNERYSTYEQIWTHCNRTAFYARSIALKYKLSAIYENVYIAGLLHDLGKIILLATDLPLTEKIAEIVQDRKGPASSSVIEEMAIGISHSTIGGMVAEKWNFPDYLVAAIRYHHSPLNTDPKFRDIVFTVYLANMICGIEGRRYSFPYIDDTVLEYFKMEDAGEFESYRTLLKKQYENLITTN
jgi:HD-like signal output (HDOD) protein